MDVVLGCGGVVLLFSVYERGWGCCDLVVSFCNELRNSHFESCMCLLIVVVVRLCLYVCVAAGDGVVVYGAVVCV